MANYRQEARRAARRHGLDPNIFERQIQQESGFQPHVVSPAGARGIAQFMPATARGMGVNPDNPTQALDGAARLMSSYVKKYGSYKNALIAYNAGPGRVGQSLPAETQNYIKTILGGSNPTGLSKPSGRAASAGGGGGGGGSITIPGSTRTVNDPEAEKRVILANFLEKRNPNSLLLKLGILDPNESTTSTVRTPSTRVNLGNDSAVSGGGFNTLGRGSVKITGPNPGRIVPEVKDFMKAVSAVAGEPIVGSDGTGHSYLTVNGNVSEHSTGHASDIPAAGKDLIHKGQAELIAAGMAPKQAT